MLCRAGLHLGATTVGRILKEKPTPERTTPPAKESKADQVVTSKYPNHVWHVDLTVVPLTHGGLWTSWFPFSLPQCWPFCWWVGVVLDHYSRRAMGVAIFRRQPTSRQVRAFLGRTITDARKAPKHLICDQGAPFDGDGFRTWCERRDIQVHYGAVGKHGSIAVIERFIKTLKDEGTRRFVLPLDSRSAKRELSLILEWYNTHRPHMTLAGQTPNEVFYGDAPASRRPRVEPRSQWPRGSPCAKPQVLVAGKPGDGFHLDLSYYQNRKHLPIVTLRRASRIPRTRLPRPRDDADSPRAANVFVAFGTFEVYSVATKSVEFPQVTRSCHRHL
jgi:putative transposase